MNPVQLAFRVLRGDRRARTSAILTTAGVAVAVALVLLLLGVPGATEKRETRAEWQQPPPSAPTVTEPGATVAMTSTEDYVEGAEITRVDAAPLGDPGDVRLPPGVDRLPAAGEALVSPALAERIESMPPRELADRFGERIVGTLDEQALRHPEQLVALAGQDSDAMPESAYRGAGFPVGTALVDPLLTLLAGVGVVVLLVPSLVLVASSARLTAARRERRLAALRLAGASPGQVVGMVGAETVLAAGAGAVAGLAVVPLLRMAASTVVWDGGTWQPGDFTLSLPLSLGVAALVAVLVVLAGVLGLRRVLTAPLAARSGHGRRAPRGWRLLAIPAAALVFGYALYAAGEAGGLMAVLLGLAAVIGSLTFVGPWITAVVGAAFVRWWRSPAALLAGRRLADDPKGAYRASAGVVLAVFVGSMGLTLLPSFESMRGADGQFRDSVVYAYPGTSADADVALGERVTGETNARLAEYGVAQRAVHVREIRIGDGNDPASFGTAMVLGCRDARELTDVPVGECAERPAVYSALPLRTGDLATMDGGARAVGLSGDAVVRRVPSEVTIVDPRLVPDEAAVDVSTVAVSSTAANRETVRTALASSGVAIRVESVEARLAGQDAELADLRRVTVIGLAAAGILAGASAAIATAGSVLDRRRTFGSLLAAGTSVTVLSRALRAEAALPALVATLGAGLAGTLVGVGLLTLIDDSAPVITGWVLAPVVLGAGVAVLAASVCRPALRRVAAEPLAEE